MISTGFQIRAGRELVGLAQADLATAAASVGFAMEVQAEVAAHMPALTHETSSASSSKDISSR